MSEPVAQILAQLCSLSQQDRAELAYAFVCSLEPEEEGVEEAWNVELSKRMTEIRSGKAEGRSAHELFAELRR
jgi:putative addiction module component (TIGR02574 family)